jgi:alginate O-acetyltransferase complex protein AlgJ
VTVSSVPDSLPPLHEAWLPREHSMHRPRHGTRQYFALICAAIFFATPLVALGIGIRPAEIENRRLAEFPGLTQGWNFLSGMSNWANDHVVFRAEALAAVDGVSRNVFGEPPKFDNPKPSVGVGVSPPVVERRANPRPEDVPDAIEGKAGWLYYGDDVQSKCNQLRSLDSTMTQLRRLREGVEASGRTFILVVAPDKTTIVPEYLPDSYIGKDCSTQVTEEFWRRLRTETGAIDLRADLHAAGRKLGMPVYPVLDGHWSDEGGLVLTRVLAETIRPGVSKGWTIEPSQPWQVPGDIPPLLGHKGTVNGMYYSLKPDGQRDRTREQSANFMTPRLLNTTSGPGTIGEQVGYLGDSFSIRALRYLSATFSQLTVMHYGDSSKDSGRAAGEMLANNRYVVFEIVERTLGSGNSVLLRQEVIDGIVDELKSKPVPN